MVFNEKHLVVVVDNVDEELAKISEIYENEGYDVNVATNYEQLRFCLDDEMPDLVVVNFKDNSSEMKELFLKVRGEDQYLELPILGIIEDTSPETIENYLDLGLDSMCNYPYARKDLLLRSEILIDSVYKAKELEKKNLAIGAIFDEVKNLKLDLKRKMEEIKRLKDTLNRVAVLDNLTGLYNRSYALDQLDMAISRYNRTEAQSSIILCNLDDFTDVNSEFGHVIGDRVLKEVAVSLSKNKRTQDVFSRYSGDTFMIVLPDTDIEGVKFFGERVRSIIESASFTDKDIKVTMSLGVATYNQVMSVDMIMMMVEDALKFGKQSGKNKVIVANELLNL